MYPERVQVNGLYSLRPCALGSIKKLYVVLMADNSREYQLIYEYEIVHMTAKLDFIHEEPVKLPGALFSR